MQGLERRDGHSFPRDVGLVTRNVPGHLAAAGRMTDAYRFVEIERIGEFDNTRHIGVHVMPIQSLGKSPVAPPVMRDHLVPLLDEEHHLAVPVIARQWSAVMKHVGAPLSQSLK